jgi:hypothetical protein
MRAGVHVRETQIPPVRARVYVQSAPGGLEGEAVRTGVYLRSASHPEVRAWVHLCSTHFPDPSARSGDGRTESRSERCVHGSLEVSGPRSCSRGTTRAKQEARSPVCNEVQVRPVPGAVGRNDHRPVRQVLPVRTSDDRRSDPHRPRPVVLSWKQVVRPMCPGPHPPEVQPRNRAVRGRPGQAPTRGTKPGGSHA